MMNSRPKREALIRARCRPRELELIRSAARVENVTMSELMRTAAVAEAKRVLAGTPT